MNGSVLNLFSDRGTLTAKDVTPWQTFSGKGMKFHLQSFDWAGCACVSHLTMRAFLGLMKMETIICTPYSKDLPLFSYDLINAIGKRTLLVEVYDTQVAPADLSTMDAVKAAYSDLDDKPMKPASRPKDILIGCLTQFIVIQRSTRMSCLTVILSN